WGRMLQADPYIEEAPSWMVGVQGLITTQAQNRYAYVDNNPLIHTDPSGYGNCDMGYNSNVCDGTQRMLKASPSANGVSGVLVGTSAGGGEFFAVSVNVSANGAAGRGSPTSDEQGREGAGVPDLKAPVGNKLSDNFRQFLFN